MNKINKKGFTLVEITVVIIILGLLSLIIVNFDYNKKTDSEKKERIANKILSILNTEKLNLKIGKGISVSSKFINPSYSKVSISTGAVLVTYYTGADINSLSLVGTGEIFKTPFYGEKQYNIKDITYYNSSGSNIGPLSKVDIFFSGDDTTMSGTNILNFSVAPSNLIGLKIQVGYNNNYKTIDFDRRTGKVSYK
ncbi:MAG: prepilin-type N-terminal cleavage/methylation domain-containing protein [Candidatus Gracilibacteria bacterium]|nr:prepilin-type N-terminal cleavage/methylation domain-containing protein [Candidatus Gracilibacteria bacterium]MDD2908554.1 prepilin-type N-terminal cleavage/methylation domain-containing protein [Candidatus Gracilibacteria bacterium]